MPAQGARTAQRRAVLWLLAAALGAASGCGGGGTGTAGDAERSAHRARQVAEAWDGSPAAAAWRAGYHPMGDVVELPRGGLRNRADQQAYRDRSFVLRGTLPAAWTGESRVTWPGKGELARPSRGAAESFKALSSPRAVGAPHLTVTGAKPGVMTVVTSRGPAVVPAWLFTLDGYTTPLKRAAALPSALPRSPIGAARDVPTNALERVVLIAADGRAVTVSAVHGACDEGPVVKVLETPGSVVLSASVADRHPGGPCTKQAKFRQLTARLGNPLGDRVLLDAHTGEPVPHQREHGQVTSWS
ncbi:hypothetical protein [Streptomyces sp. NPDC058657]|uniref:hypothetical protein n=1 Tax=unclassified Streptomyces TaxID=2593676 RepID=UPI00364C4C70